MNVDFKEQYNSVYKIRLSQIKKLIIDNPRVKESGIPVVELNDDNIDKTCLVPALFFLKSPLKPSILKQYSDSINDEPAKTYIDSDSCFLIEDLTGVLDIEFKECCEKPYSLLTGMVAGFIGHKNIKNIFECTEIVYPVPLAPSTKIEDKHVLVISNMRLAENNIMALKVILDYCHNKADEVILIGDISNKSTLSQSFESLNFLLENYNKKVNIVPGFEDPTSKLLPQLPLHRMMFDKNLKIASQLSNIKDLNNKTDAKVKTLYNPSFENILGRNFILLSHHIIADMVKYVPSEKILDLNKPLNAECAINILEQLLKIRHILPNAPDTLHCIPYTDFDPFIIQDCDVIITGGCDKTVCKNIAGKILMCIPDYDATGIAVLLNIGSSEFQQIVFK